MTLYRAGTDSPDRRGARPGRRERQAGRRPGRAEGPLRRGEQHPVGAVARASGRPRRLRRRGPEDARQDRARGPARGQRHAPLRPRRDRQLQPGDRAHLHGPRALHRPRRVRHDASELFNFLTGFSKTHTLQAPDRRAVHPSREGPVADRPRGREGARRDKPGAIVAKLNSLVDPSVIRALYRASSAGVADRPRRARDLLPAAGRARRLRQDLGLVRRRAVPRAQPRASPSASARRRRSSSRAPTGCRATSTAASS